MACPPAPAIGWSAALVSPPSAATWWAGANAADNVNQRYYYTTGNPADGIQRIPFGAIGTGAPPVNFLAPAGFNQITGMVVDPGFASGDVLLITDGFIVLRYHAPTAAIIGGPWAGPVPVGNALTGLAHNPFNNRLYAIDDSSAMWSRPLGGGPWAGPVLAAVPVPVRATGVVFCQTAPGAPFASYFNGIVMRPATGLMVPFPPAGAGIRHHRGLTFIALPVGLGGGGDPLWRPRVDIGNGFAVGSTSTTIELIGPGAPMVLLVDLAPVFAPGIAIPGVGGLLMVSPATSISAGFGAGTHSIPLSLVPLPTGIGLTFQAAGLPAGGPELSEAIYIMTHL